MMVGKISKELITLACTNSTGKRNFTKSAVPNTANTLNGICSKILSLFDKHTKNTKNKLLTKIAVINE